MRWNESIARNLETRWRQSGLSLAKFCRHVGIAQSSFDLWRRKMRAPDIAAAAPGNTGSSAFVEVVVDRRTSSTCGADPKAIEILLPNGMILRSTADFDSRRLVDIATGLAGGRP